jgi:hypothetical protein
MTPLDDWRAQRVADRAFARRMLRAWPHGAHKLSLASLASRLGELRRGVNEQWWCGRRALLRLAADVLDADVEDLIDRVRLEPKGVAFAEFPRLPPLAPGQEPCRVSRSGWLLDQVLAALEGLDTENGGVVWIVAPPGAGKSLCVRLLNDRHSVDIVAKTVRTLEAGAVIDRDGAALVIQVEEAESGADARALEALGARLRPVVVLTALEPPEAHAGWAYSWLAHPWLRIMRYAFCRGWRRRLVRWVDHRLDASDRETRFDPERVIEWLECHDPSQRLVATPGALLALCAVFDSHAGDESGVSTFARRWLELMAPALATPDGDSPGVSAAAYESLAVEHFLRTHEQYGLLTASNWARLLPPELAPGSGGTPGSAKVIAEARQAGWLRGNVQGLTLYPGWVSEGLIREALAECFDDPDLAWGLLAADASRQALVDAALDALPNGGLRRLARVVAKQPPPRMLARVAAVEAVVAALARRFDHRELALEGQLAEDARRLLLFQLDLLKAVALDVHRPVSRPDRAEWIATAWALSFLVEAPASFSREDLAWQLPGWAPRLALSELPGDLLPWSEVMSSEAGDTWGTAQIAVRRIARRAFQVVAQLAPGDIPVDVPRVLLPALLFGASERGWRLQWAHLQQLAGSWEESFLAHVAGQHPPALRRELVAQLWELLAGTTTEKGNAPVVARMLLLKQQHVALRQLVLEHVKPELVASTVRQCGLQRQRVGTRGYLRFDTSVLSALPGPTLRAALLAWLETAGERGATFDEARELVPLLDAVDEELAIEFNGAVDSVIAAEFLGVVWSTAPERAREAAAEAFRAGRPLAKGWFVVAPGPELAGLARVVMASSQRPDWVREWATWRLPEGGEVAEVLYALAR